MDPVRLLDPSAKSIGAPGPIPAQTVVTPLSVLSGQYRARRYGSVQHEQPPPGFESHTKHAANRQDRAMARLPPELRETFRRMSSQSEESFYNMSKKGIAAMFHVLIPSVYVGEFTPLVPTYDPSTDNSLDGANPSSEFTRDGIYIEPDLLWERSDLLTVPGLVHTHMDINIGNRTIHVVPGMRILNGLPVKTSLSHPLSISPLLTPDLLRLVEIEIYMKNGLDIRGNNEQVVRTENLRMDNTMMDDMVPFNVTTVCSGPASRDVPTRFGRRRHRDSRGYQRIRDDSSTTTASGTDGVSGKGNRTALGAGSEKYPTSFSRSVAPSLPYLLSPRASPGASPTDDQSVCSSESPHVILGKSFGHGTMLCSLANNGPHEHPNTHDAYDYVMFPQLIAARMDDIEHGVPGDLIDAEGSSTALPTPPPSLAVFSTSSAAEIPGENTSSSSTFAPVSFPDPSATPSVSKTSDTYCPNESVKARPTTLPPASRIGNFFLSSCPGKKLRLDSAEVLRSNRTAVFRDVYVDLWRARRQGVEAVVCCIDDEELSYLGVPWSEYSAVATQLGLTIVRIPMLEGFAPASLTAVDAALTDIIRRFTLRGASVLAHCRGGIGRAGLVAACWFLKMGLVAFDRYKIHSLYGIPNLSHLDDLYTYFGRPETVSPDSVDAQDDAEMRSKQDGLSTSSRSRVQSDARPPSRAHDTEAGRTESNARIETPCSCAACLTKIRDTLGSAPRTGCVVQDLQIVEKVLDILRRKRMTKAIETPCQVKFVYDYVGYLRVHSVMSTTQPKSVRKN